MANSPMGSGSANNFSFKVVLLGEGCVGKTSVVLRYVEDKFNDRHITTLQSCGMWRLCSKYERHQRTFKSNSTIMPLQ
ncbi:Ras- protein Rab-21 [Homalodisca vitripennis]|nr:Ras- protein Rab-21 [Homalodisca vitripennis]